MKAEIDFVFQFSLFFRNSNLLFALGSRELVAYDIRGQFSRRLFEHPEKPNDEDDPPEYFNSRPFQEMVMRYFYFLNNILFRLYERIKYRVYSKNHNSADGGTLAITEKTGWGKDDVNLFSLKNEKITGKIPIFEEHICDRPFWSFCHVSSNYSKMNFRKNINL